MLLVLLLLLGTGLGVAVWSLPQIDAGLTHLVLENLERSGVESAVTAVLMNFRGYDTFLEMTVLLVSLLGVRSLAAMPPRPARPPGIVLSFLVQLLVPFLILFAAYLVWAGSQEPGGAFQAGAVVAAAGVLLALAGDPPPVRLPSPVERILMLLGLATFIAVGLGAMAAGGHFLEFPAAGAKLQILLIEAAATVSIGLTLLALFRGGRPVGRRDPR